MNLVRNNLQYLVTFYLKPLPIDIHIDYSEMIFFYDGYQSTAMYVNRHVGKATLRGANQHVWRDDL